MFSLAWIRRIGPLVLGLFLLAQAAAIAPLISADMQHSLAIEQDIAADLGQSGLVDHAHRHRVHRDSGSHDHSANDPNDQCCVLHHHSAAVVPAALRVNEPHLTAAPAALPTPSLAGSYFGTPDRPPKPPLSI